MQNYFTRKTLFNAKWLFKVIQGHLFNVAKKRLGNYILRHNLVSYEISKGIATARSKNDNFRRNHSFHAPDPANLHEYRHNP